MDEALAESGQALAQDMKVKAGLPGLLVRLLRKELTRRAGQTPVDHLYDLACRLALSGRPAAALRTLQQVLALGYLWPEWILMDPDLAALRSRPGFRKLLPQIAT